MSPLPAWWLQGESVNFELLGSLASGFSFHKIFLGDLKQRKPKGVFQGGGLWVSRILSVALGVFDL